MTEFKVVKVHHWYGNDSACDDYEAIISDDGTIIPLEEYEDMELLERG